MLSSSPTQESYKTHNRFTFQALLFAILAAWLCFECFETIALIFRYYNQLPVWDYWRIPENLAKYQAFDVTILWKQHNEHRIIFPELVFVADMLLWHGSEILPLLVSVATYVGIWVALSFVLFSVKSISFEAKSFACLLGAIVMFWGGSVCVLAAPFLLQWPLMQLAVAGALILLAYAKRDLGNRALAASIASAVVATYSSGNGMFVWPVLLGAGIILRLNRRQMIILTAAAIASIGVYFIGYKFSSSLNIRAMLAHPFFTLGFIGSYLSMPFAGYKPPQFGIRIGLISLAVVIYCLVLVIRAGRIRQPIAIVLFGSYAFTLLTALVTAGGRMNPEDPTMTSAKAPRYVTVPMVNWAVFVFICFWVLAEFRSRRSEVRALAIAMTLLLYISFTSLRVWLRDAGNDFSEQQMTALSIEDGLRDPKLLEKAFPGAEFILAYLPKLEKERLSVFHNSRAGWIGKPVTQFASIHSTVATGEIVTVLPIRSGIELSGWVDDSTLRGPYTWIVLVNEVGRIVGFGKRLPAGFPPDLRSPRIPSALGWVGFVSTKQKVAAVTAYVVDGRKKWLVPLEGAVPLPPLQALGADELGPPLPRLPWQTDPSWTVNRLPERVHFGPAPPGPVYASWSGSDALTGQALSGAFPSPANNCLIMPVLHGPSVGGLSVELQDAVSGEKITAAPMRDSDTRWSYWRVTVPPTAKQLRILARDDGKKWGQWVGVSDPLACR